MARTLLSAVITVLWLCWGFAAPASARDKNLKAQTDAWGETEISFCARPSPNSLGFPGHAFVGFSEQPTGKPRTYRAVGHTVGSSANVAPTIFTYFGGAAVSGQQAEERYTHMKQACLTLKVDRAVYQKAINAARPTLTVLGIPDAVAASLERYSLNDDDCVDFAIKVALQLKPAGLIVPNRIPTDTPSVYIARLKNQNP